MKIIFTSLFRENIKINVLQRFNYYIKQQNDNKNWI